MIGRNVLRRIDPALAAILFAFAVLQLCYLDYSPIWDTTAYSECLHDAVAARSLSALNCFHHPTMGYLSFLALAQIPFFSAFASTHVVNILLGLCALAAFHDVLRVLLPDSSSRPERLLATALLAMLPVVNANLLNWTPDYGVYVFYLLFLRALLRGLMLPTIIFGLLLTFSKESGAFMYGVTLGCWLVSQLDRTTWQRRREWWKRAVFMGLPPIILITWYVVRSQSAPGPTQLWRGLQPIDLARSFFTFSFNKHLLAYFVSTFVINFLWLPTLIMLSAGVITISKLLRSPALDASRRRALFLVLTLGLSFYGLTRYETFTHLRYLLVLYPLSLLIFTLSLNALTNKALRYVTLAICLVLFSISNVRTIDPVSRRIYGTFPFGNHSLLTMTSITGECCGHGLDGLTYNLEFAQIHYLVDEALRDVKPGTDDVFAMSEAARAWIVYRLDKTTYARTLDRAHSFAPAHFGVEPTRDFPTRKKRVIFVDVPTADSTQALAILRYRYPELSARTYERHGYRLTVTTFDGRAKQ